MAVEKVTIGTRGSNLALWQSNHVLSLLQQRFPEVEFRVVTIKTLGDKILDSPLSKIGDKGLFTKEIERALLDKQIDLAVHSFKDVPTEIPDGLTIGSVLEREDVRDVFIAHPAKNHARFSTLPVGASVATGSLRRRCQLLHARPDIAIVDLRGNLNTRMDKLGASSWDGMILARAGVVRLGWENRISEILPFDLMLPAVGQGALAIEIRSGDARVAELVGSLNHEPTAQSISGERALLRHLEGGCQIPIGTHGRMENGRFLLDAVVGSLDGKRVIRASIQGNARDAASLGVRLAEQLAQQGGREILAEIRSGSAVPPPAV